MGEGKQWHNILQRFVIASGLAQSFSPLPHSLLPDLGYSVSSWRFGTDESEREIWGRKTQVNVVKDILVE